MDISEVDRKEKPFETIETRSNDEADKLEAETSRENSESNKAMPGEPVVVKSPATAAGLNSDEANINDTSANSDNETKGISAAAQSSPNKDALFTKILKLANSPVSVRPLNSPTTSPRSENETTRFTG